MGETLNLTVHGDPASCRATGDALRKLHVGITDAATAMHHATSRSDSVWQGSAAEGFRKRISAAGGASDRAASAADRGGQALQVFADDLITVKTRMDQARSVAEGAGLTVNGDTIEAPGAPTLPAPGTHVSPQEAQAAHAAAGRFAAQQKAFTECAQTVHEARGIETRAHESLSKTLKAMQTVADDLCATSTWPWLSAGTGAALGGTLATQAAKWADKANEMQKSAAIARTVFQDGSKPIEERLAALHSWFDNSKNSWKAEGFSDSTSAAMLHLDKTAAGRGLLQVLNFSAKDGAEQVGLSVAEKAAPILERIPLIGLGIAGVQTAYDSTYGHKNAAVAAGEDIGGFAASTAATEGLIAAGCAGGPLTLVAVGVGVGVGIGVSEIIDHRKAIGHFFSGVGHDIGSGVKHLGSDIASIF